MSDRHQSDRQALQWQYQYRVNEVDDFQGVDGAGGVFSGSVDKNGKLTKISSAPTGAGPVSCDLSKDGHSLAVAS